ncbi:MAG: DUF4065 domain-containing protein [Candidatus Kapabacteria bacterium]|nr:DUF4065 domain-containing protein [Candidatus Kapabacteria bacterium]
MTLCKERRTVPFRKEDFEIVFHFYKCEDTKEQFTSTELDELNMAQVYNQYRDKFNIPFPDEIIRIREKYSVPVTKMSAILGFGINSYGQYEKGEMPSISNARLIQSVANPKNFIENVRLCEFLDEKEQNKYLKKAQALEEEHKRNIFSFNLKDYLLGDSLADIYSGYRNPSFEKFTEMVVYFSEKVQPFKTKMNKLLFYADFLMFRQSCFSISGTRYTAINMGPVPHNFQSIFEYLANEGEIDIYYFDFPNGGFGEQFIARKDRAFNANLFSKEELGTLEKVATAFKDTSTNDIVELSHLEKAWKENQKTKNVISYEYAFEIEQI